MSNNPKSKFKVLRDESKTILVGKVAERRLQGWRNCSLAEQ